MGPAKLNEEGTNTLTGGNRQYANKKLEILCNTRTTALTNPTYKTSYKTQGIKQTATKI